jgi:GBP family porin
MQVSGAAETEAMMCQLALSLALGFSNAAGQFANNRAYSFGASYSFGGLYFAAAYMEISNDLNALNVAASAPGAVAGDESFTAGRQRTWGAGLSYKFGPAVAGFVFTQTRLSNANAVNNAGGTVNLRAGSSLRFNNFEVNGRYNLTSALSIAGNYTYTDGKLNNADPKWHQFDLAAVYSLSKRTDAYVQAEYQRVIATGTPFTAVINGLNLSSNDKQVAVTAGLRHRF